MDRTGPHRVIIQDGNHTVWTTQAGKLFRRAPEHVRPALPEEVTSSPEEPCEWSTLEQQIQRMSRSVDEIPTDQPPVSETSMPNAGDPENQPPGNVPMEREVSVPETVPQPDHEPEHSQATPPEISSEEDSSLEVVGLYCEDDDTYDDVLYAQEDTAWRCEIDISLDQSLRDHQPSLEESCVLLATNAKKQRTEVKLSTLSPSEKARSNLTMDAALPPRISDLEPRTSDLEPRTSNLGPRVSDLGPRTSDLEPRVSDLGSRTSNLGPRTSDLGPRVSDLGSRTSRLAPRTSDLEPRTSGRASQMSDTLEQRFGMASLDVINIAAKSCRQIDPLFGRVELGHLYACPSLVSLIDCLLRSWFPRWVLLAPLTAVEAR